MANTTLPSIDINKAAADFNNAVKEGAYIAVGLGVLGFQRAQVRRVELAKQIEAQRQQLSSQFENYGQAARAQTAVAFGQLAEQLSELSKNLEEFAGPARLRLSQLAQTELPQLPDLGGPVKEATSAVEEQLDALRTQLTDLARTLDERLQPIRRQLDEQIDRLEQRLPAGARGVVQSVRASAAAPEQAFRTAVGLD